MNAAEAAEHAMRAVAGGRDSKAHFMKAVEVRVFFFVFFCFFFLVLATCMAS